MQAKSGYRHLHRATTAVHSALEASNLPRESVGCGDGAPRRARGAGRRCGGERINQVLARAASGSALGSVTSDMRWPSRLIKAQRGLTCTILRPTLHNTDRTATRVSIGLNGSFRRRTIDNTRRLALVLPLIDRLAPFCGYKDPQTSCSLPALLSFPPPASILDTCPAPW